MSKHEARTSLLSGAASDNLYTPSAYGRSMDEQYSYGGYAQREGLQNAVPRDQQRPSWWYVPNSKWTWAFSGLVLFQAVVALVLEGYFFGVFQSDLTGAAKDKSFTQVVPTYLSLFIFGFLYQIALTYDALRLKNTIQIFGLCLYNLGLTIEAAVQYQQTFTALEQSTNPTSKPDSDQNEDNASLLNPSFQTTVKPIIIALPTFIGIVTLILAFIAWKLNDEFAWSIYKNISADLRLKKRYLTYQIYISLLKFDFFTFLAFTVQFLVILPRDTSSENAEFWITVAAIPVTVAVLFLAAFWTRRENVIGMIFTLVFFFGGLAYFCFKLFRMYLSNPAQEAVYYPARHVLTTFAVITLVLVVVTIVYTVMCMANFNKGLKPHVQSTRSRRRAGSTDMDKLFNSNDVPLATGPLHGPVRMEID